MGTIFLHCDRLWNSARNGICQSIQTLLISKRLSIAFKETGVLSSIMEFSQDCEHNQTGLW